MTEKPEARVPEIGDYVRTKGRLVKIEDVTPPPPAQVLDYIFEAVTAKVRAFANNNEIAGFSEFNDFYGENSCVDHAIAEARKVAETYGPAIDVRVYKIVSQTRMRPQNDRSLYDRQFADFQFLSSGWARNLPEPVETVVWSSKTDK